MLRQTHSEDLKFNDRFRSWRERAASRDKALAKLIISEVLAVILTLYLAI